MNYQMFELKHADDAASRRARLVAVSEPLRRVLTILDLHRHLPAA